AFVILNALVIVPPSRGQPVANTPAEPEQTSNSKNELGHEAAVNKASASEKIGKGVAPLNKRERKEQKRERQREQMLRRIEQRAQGGFPKRSIPPPPPPNHPNPYQVNEDFDRPVNWEQKNNRDQSNTGYGYSTNGHLASEGCAPGEIGGSVSDSGISWFADNIAFGSALLDVETPFSASG